MSRSVSKVAGGVNGPEEVSKRGYICGGDVSDAVVLFVGSVTKRLLSSRCSEC
jgi:hypothetical protein